MSDKLIVEFYSRDQLEKPKASILASHGGDNPSSAATTLKDFFDEVSSLRDPRFNDISVLAARFVVWESSKSAADGSLDFIDVAILDIDGPNPYQTARVYEHNTRPYVHFVTDEFTSAQELIDAALILGQETVCSYEIGSKAATRSGIA